MLPTDALTNLARHHSASAQALQLSFSVIAYMLHGFWTTIWCAVSVKPYSLIRSDIPGVGSHVCMGLSTAAIVAILPPARPSHSGGGQAFSDRGYGCGEPKVSRRCHHRKQHSTIPAARARHHEQHTLACVVKHLRVCHRRIRHLILGRSDCRRS